MKTSHAIVFVFAFLVSAAGVIACSVFWFPYILVSLYPAYKKMYARFFSDENFKGKLRQDWQEYFGTKPDIVGRISLATVWAVYVWSRVVGSPEDFVMEVHKLNKSHLTFAWIFCGWAWDAKNGNVQL